ncbi:MAG: 16S rRNA (uracil1498-N3)-methyltransferase [Candidatus Krumholzibacteriia bacterium]
MRQFFLDVSDDQTIAVGETVTLDRDESHHLATVLRGGRESELRLVDGRGNRFTGEAAGKDGKCALVKITSAQVDPEEHRRPGLVLSCAVVKGKRFEWALEKAVELGAHTIVPLLCDHGVIEPREGKQSRWLAMMKSAVKQCGRSWLPKLASPQTLAGVLASRNECVHFYGVAPYELPADEVPFWRTLLDTPAEDPPGELNFLVGPEGGWSSAELSQLEKNATAVSLGPHILRAETAAAAGLTALQAVRQAWSSPASDN